MTKGDMQSQDPSTDIIEPEPTVQSTLSHRVPDLRNILGTTTGQELSQLLESAQLQTTAYIHPRPIAFSTSAFKAKWVNDFADARDWDTYNGFNRGLRAGRNSLAIFGTSPRTSIGCSRKEWLSDEWHCWGAVVLRDQSKHFNVLMIDCNANTTLDYTSLRQIHLLHNNQIKLLETIRQANLLRKRRIDSIWYGNSGWNCFQDQCVLETVNWMNTILPQLERPFEGPGDVRLSGFKQITAK